jgi:ProP effector
MMTDQNSALAQAFQSAIGEKSARQQQIMIIELLYQRYPVMKQFKPLMIGVHKELEKALPQFGANHVHRSIAAHCRKVRYLKAVARGGKRFDLNGKPVGDVTLEEKTAAAKFVQNIEDRKKPATAVVAEEVAADPIVTSEVIAEPVITDAESKAE